MKSILSSKSNPRFAVLLAALVISFFVFGSGLAVSQTQEGFQTQQQQITSINSAAAAQPGFEQTGDIKTFWSLTKLGGGISVAIAVVLALGIFLIVIQMYELISDKIKGRMLLSLSYRKMSIGEVNKIVMKNPDNFAARLYSILLSIFHTTGETRDFHDEIANYIVMQQDRFGTFKSRLLFLSDTAGALGLLGTIWGMFATFFGGNLDSQRILNGMGLALVTTLIGLVVSIILNFFATEVFSVFNKRMELLASKADELRIWLMAIVHQRNKKNGGPAPAGNGGTPGGHREPVQTPATANPTLASALALKSVSEFRQDGTLGHALAKPITVFVELEDGTKMPGVPVQFEIRDGGGGLDNRRKLATLKTDKHGFAEVNWTLGEQVGSQRLKVSIPNDEIESLEFVAFAQPFIPNLEAIVDELPNNQFQNRGMVS